MTNFLEELYYGNIDPQARGYRKGSYNFKVSQNINELEEKLTERLGGEDKALFLDFCNAYGELMGESSLDSFKIVHSKSEASFGTMSVSKEVFYYG